MFPPTHTDKLYLVTGLVLDTEMLFWFFLLLRQARAHNGADVATTEQWQG